MTGCADTLQGTVHRFPDPNSPCYCGEVIRNRRQHPRVIVAPAKPTGARTAPVVNLIQRKGQLTVAQIALELEESRQWVKYALIVLQRARKVLKAGMVTETDARGYQRSVAIYTLPPSDSYTKPTHVP